MNESRFRNVVVFGDEGAEFIRILGESHPNVGFLNPPIPAFGTSAFYPSMYKLMPLFLPDSLIISLGSIFAITVQEGFPHLNLSVFAVNPPLDELALMWKGANRAVLYSSQYEPIKAYQPEEWSRRTDYAYDVPWLSRGVGGALYATSYLASVFMRGLDLRKEVLTMPQTQTGISGI